MRTTFIYLPAPAPLVRDRRLVLAIALALAIPVIGALPLIPTSNRQSTAAFSGFLTFDAPHATNTSSLLANRVTFAWNLSMRQPFREESSEPVAFSVRAAIGPGVRNVSMGTVSVLLFDTSGGRPRLVFNGETGVRYVAPLAWTDWGDDYVLVASADRGPYYFAMWLVETVFYNNGQYGLFGDAKDGLHGVAVLAARDRIDPVIVVAGEMGAG